jgi:hypothetical protein
MTQSQPPKEKTDETEDHGNDDSFDGCDHFAAGSQAGF